MKKKIIIIFIASIFLLALAIAYFNAVVLPVKIRSLIIQGIREATQKNATIESLHFSIFKGLVFKNLVVYDEKETFLTLKEGSCNFLIPALFFKKIVIPELKIKSLTLYLRREADNTLNVKDIFTALKTIKDPGQNKKFSLFIYKIAVIDSRINFEDKALTPEFRRTADKLNLALHLSLPAAIKFKLNFNLAGAEKAKVSVSGEYKIAQKELSAQAAIEDLPAAEFSAYWQNLGVSFSQGVIDAVSNISFKEDEGVVYADAKVKSKDLKLSKNNVRAQVNLDLGASLQYSLKDNQLKGSGNIFNALLKTEKAESSFENISGRFNFASDLLKWSELKLELASNELFLESELQVSGKIIKFSKLNGRYLNSDFSISGSADTTNPASLQVDIAAQAQINLKDLKERFRDFKEPLEKIQLSGAVNAKINLNGNISNIKTCLIKADLSSPSISVYGLKLENLFINCLQKEGLLALPFIRFSFYDGAITANANINLISENLAYAANIKADGVKLEKLKLDTAAKEKDIAGALKGETEIYGDYKDASKISGAGKISISEGKLWELNLFRGLGKLLFAKDFAGINIKEGRCDFFIRDKFIFSDNLKMEGDFIDLSGSTKIGFDGSIDTTLNVQVNDEMVPLTGTFKDVTSAIIGQAGKFGVIKISGSLKEPKYKFHPLAFDVLKSLKKVLFE